MYFSLYLQHVHVWNPKALLQEDSTGKIYRWQTKNRPAVTWTTVGVDLGLCTGN